MNRLHLRSLLLKGVIIILALACLLGLTATAPRAFAATAVCDSSGNCFDYAPIPTANSWPTSIVGSNIDYWFTEFNGNKIGHAKLVEQLGVTALTEFSIPTPGSGPQAITSGPDGNLWFTELKANKIGRMTPSGVFTEYAIPTANSEPAGITSDGTNLWFTEYNGNKIGEITTSGAFLGEYVIPTANSGPLGITYRGEPANSVSRIWFTEYNASKIGHTELQAHCTGVPPHLNCVFTLVIVDSPLPTANSKPYGITTAVDGATLWFTEQAANQIGEIPSGSPITEYPLPTANSQPMGISAYAGGGAEFAEFNGNKIGFTGLAGPGEPNVIGEVPLPTAQSGPMDVCGGGVGFEGAYVEASANQIGDVYVVLG